MNRKLKILIGILVVGLAVVAGWWIWSGQSPFKPREVAITTDKTEYKQGETVKIGVRNGLDQSVWYFRACGEARFWSLDKLGESKWTAVKFFLPELVEEEREGLRIYKEECDLKLCERQAPIELERNSEITHDWQLGNICIFPESPVVGFPEAELKPIEEGTYRVSFTYGLSKDEEGFGLLEEKTIYSNEFTIKAD